MVRQLGLQLAADFIGETMEWVCQGGKVKQSSLKVRMLALVWMTNPALFGNQAELAASIGVSRKVVNTAVTEFRDTYGYVLPSMRTDATRKQYSHLKKKFHAEKADRSE